MQGLVNMLQADAATVQTSLQVAWMFLNACLIFFMQVRFRLYAIAQACVVGTADSPAQFPVEMYTYTSLSAFF